jgi:hypothetical protein
MSEIMSMLKPGLDFVSDSILNVQGTWFSPNTEHTMVHILNVSIII